MIFKKILTLIFMFNCLQTLVAQSEPNNQPTALSFLGVKAYGMSLSFTLSDASHYLILRSGSPVTGAPVDGTEYLKGDRIGNAKVLAIGSNSFYTFREAIANTDYHFAIYAFNDGTTPNYKTNSPLTGSITTTGKEIGNYYTNYRIDTDDAIDDLTDLLKAHTVLDYNSDYYDVIDNFYEKDTVIAGESKKYVVCEYSNYIQDFDDNNFSFSDLNREHVFAKSWMPSDPSGNDLTESADFHNLFLVEADVNQTMRSNKIFDEVVNTTQTFIDAKSGTNIDNDNAFEPKEDIKGNVARALFYMAVTYNGKSGSWAFDNLQSFGSDQDVDLLLQWHAQDPVDDYEIARNEYIYQIQNSRNAFIDFPEWTSCIDFKTLTLNGNCPLDTAQNIADGIISFDKENTVLVYPNPIQEKAFVNLAENEEINKIELYDSKGNVVDFNYNLNSNISNLTFTNIPNSFYFLKIYSSKAIYAKKINIRN